MSLEKQANAISVTLSQGIDVNKIEKQLASMWSNAGGSEKEGTRTGVTRACTQNLIVYTTPSEDREQLEDLLSRMNEEHPGRTLILVADRETWTPRLEAYVSMRCRLLGATGKQICGEQVTIEAAGPHVETAATAVAPLLVPDLPVYLWWKDIPHYEDKLFDRMAQMADRLVIDSAAFDHPHDDLLRLAAAIASRRMRVSDLNWSRLSSWRTLLASFWDVPEYRSLLNSIDRVEIKHRAPHHAPGEITPKALLLAGWLAARLGWELVTGHARPDQGAFEFELSSAHHEIALSLLRDESADCGKGMISSVVLHVRERAAQFQVLLRNDGTKLETVASIGATRSVGRVLGYERRSEAARLSGELSFLTHDSIFEEAVARSARFVAALSRPEGTA